MEGYGSGGGPTVYEEKIAALTSLQKLEQDKTLNRIQEAIPLHSYTICKC